MIIKKKRDIDIRRHCYIYIRYYRSRSRCVSWRYVKIWIIRSSKVILVRVTSTTIQKKMKVDSPMRHRSWLSACIINSPLRGPNRADLACSLDKLLHSRPRKGRATPGYVLCACVHTHAAGSAAGSGTWVGPLSVAGVGHRRCDEFSIETSSQMTPCASA